MRIIGLFLFLGGAIFAGYRIYMRLHINQEYNQKIENFWTMADRASTIKQKSEYVNKFVSALEMEKLQGFNDKLVFQVPTSGFDENFKALKSLQGRLKEISIMDENSFAYQTAMHQITEQEQGEANEMIGRISGCWERKNYYTYWNPVFTTLFFIIQLLFLAIGAAWIFGNYD